MASNAKIRLKTVVDSLDDVPEQFRDLYREGDGDFADRYVLDPEEAEGYGLANSGRLTGALDKERRTAKLATKERDEIRRKLDALAAEKAALEEQLTAGVPDAQKLREQLSAQIGKSWESKLKAREEELAAQLQALTQERDGLSKQFGATLFDAELGRVANGGKWKFSPRIMAPLIQGRTRIENEDGKIVLRVLDANGEPKFANGRPATLEDLVAEYARDAEFGSLIARADQQPPSGTPPRGAARPNGQSGNRGPITLTREQCRNFEFFKSESARAKAEGRELLIERDSQGSGA
jgi:hypothetical protein